MSNIAVTAETADRIASLAPAMGMVATRARNVIAPGVVQIEVSPFVALKIATFPGDSDDARVNAALNAA